MRLLKILLAAILAAGMASAPTVRATAEPTAFTQPAFEAAQKQGKAISGPDHRKLVPHLRQAAPNPQPA